MEVILIEDVENLGSEGEVVDVAGGYARNYLFPKRLAVEATKGKKKQIKHKKKKRKRKEKEKIADAREMAENLEQEKFVFPVKAGENGKLFGSVTSKDIGEKVNNVGYDIDRKEIDLDNNIKELGVHKIPVKIYKDVYADIKVEVVEADQE